MLLSSRPTLRPPPQARRRPPPQARRRLALSRQGSPLHARFSLEARDGSPKVLASHHLNPVLVSQSSPPPLATNLGLRRDPELGLLSLLFVISVAMGAFFSLAVIALPALSAFRRLAVSVDELSKVVSEEVPGTLSSLKLSGLEINDLTSQLNNLRQRISGNQYGKKVRTNNSTSHGRRRNRIIN